MRIMSADFTEPNENAQFEVDGLDGDASHESRPCIMLSVMVAGVCIFSGEVYKASLSAYLEDFIVCLGNMKVFVNVSSALLHPGHSL